MPFKDHFSARAAQYAQYRPRYPEELFTYLAGLCPERQRAWDCGCGSGQASVSLAEHFDQVIATDASRQQIDAAEPHARVGYSVAPAEESGLECESIDLIVVAQALHWFDLTRFYSEAARVLKPQGVIAAWTYGDPQLADGALEPIFAAFRKEIAPYWPSEREAVNAGYRDLPFPFPELLAPSFELREHWPLQHLLGYLTTWSSVAKYYAQTASDPVAAVASKLRAAWGDAERTKLIRWPLFMRLGRKPQAHRRPIP